MAKSQKREWERSVEDAIKRQEGSKKCTGLPTLKKQIAPEVVDAVAEWLNLGNQQDLFRPICERHHEARNSEIVTEDGTAIEFAELHGDKLRYCHDTGAWFRWDGTIWRQSRTGIAFQWARELARSMSECEPDKLRYATSRVSFSGGVERFARCDPVFAVTAEVWDNDPWLLGTPGGTVDLRTGELRPAQQTDLITKATAVAPAQAADCPTWRKFIKDATGNDDELARFMQRWAGVFPYRVSLANMRLSLFMAPAEMGKAFL